MTNSRKILVFSVVLAFVLVSIPAGYWIPGRMVLFNSEKYQNELVKTGFYSKLPVTMAQILFTGDQTWSENFRIVTTNAENRKVIEKMVEFIFPADWFEEYGKEYLKEIISYINFQKDRLNLILDLESAKTRLQSSDLQTQLLIDLPACDKNDIIRFIQPLLSGNTTNIILCRPPQELLATVQPVFSIITRQISTSIPDRIDLAELGGNQSINSFLKTAHWQSFWDRYRTVRKIIDYAPIMSVLFLIIMIGLVGKPISLVLETCGNAFILAGLVGASINGLLFLVSAWVGYNSAELTQIYLHISLLDLVLKSVAAVFKEFTLLSCGSALILGMCGGVMKYISFATRKDG
jgi:hypothetical protein